MALKREKFLTQDEVQRLLQVAKEHDPVAYRMIFFAYHLGLRSIELVKLRYEDFDLESLSVAIKTAKQNKKRKIRFCEGCEKVQQTGNYCDECGNKEWGEKWVRSDKEVVDTLPCPPKLFEVLGPTTEGWLFPNDLGDRISTRTAQRTYNRVAEKAGIKVKHKGLHTLRHGYCMRIAETNADIATCRQLMRHRSVQSTDVYMHSVKTRETMGKIQVID